jgi:hypothetical protein
MRRRFVLAFAMLAFCTEQNRVFVHTTAEGNISPPDVGDDIDLLHVPTDGYTAQKPGFYVVHDLNDWLFIWKDPRPDAKPPPPPQAIDFDKEMVIVATAPTEGARRIEIRKIVGENSGLHVYVTETLGGSTCAKRQGPPPMDMVVIPTSPDDVHVHHDRVRDADCGPPPEAVIACRVVGSGVVGQSKITVSAGQTIDCDSSASKPHTGALTERSWQLSSAPQGSMSKLTLGGNAIGMTMPIDAWGTYVIGLQVRDEAQGAQTSATIDAPPPSIGVPLALQWASTDRNDEVNMYPRVELHVVDNGNASNDCGPAAAKTWCEVHAVGAVEDAVVRAEPGKTYRVYVSYQDFRLRGAPVPCVRTYPKGAPSKLVCDEQQRKAGDLWEVGALDDGTRAPIATPSTADAGAPPARDAGARSNAPRDAGAAPSHTLEHKLPF